MSVEFVVPQLGESITEAVVGKWNKQVGDSVNADEAVVVLETDKVTVDVPAPAAGALSQISFKEGDRVKVGDVLGSINPGAAGTSAAAKPAPSAGGNGKGAGAIATSVAQESAERQTALTPVAKRLVEERGIDPSSIRGSGPGGKILKGDVLGQSQPSGGGAVSTKASIPASAPSAPRAIQDREERVKMTPLRRRVAERLLQAQSTAAILTTFNECDMGEVMALRKQYSEKFQARHGVKLGFMSFFVRAAIEALRAFPQLNAEIDGEDVIFKHYHDIGVAVSGSRGLVVPVLRDADRMTMADLEKNIADFGVRARNDKLTLEDLKGGTFTISNGGIFGSMLSTPILNPPQVGILGMHNIVERPVVRNGEIVVRPIMFLALSYDHRLVDGREAVQFLVRVKECVEDPERLLLEV